MLRESPQQRPNIYQVVAESCAMRHRACPIKDVRSAPQQSKHHWLSIDLLWSDSIWSQTKWAAAAKRAPGSVTTAGDRNPESCTSTEGAAYSGYHSDEKGSTYCPCSATSSG